MLCVCDERASVGLQKCIMNMYMCVGTVLVYCTCASEGRDALSLLTLSSSWL